MSPEFFASDRKEWRSWLEKNHTGVEEVWLVYFKRHTGNPSISYRDSVEEALCFGWIDGLKRSIDAKRYAHRFTPRKPGSRWSPLNIELAGKMIEKGRMKPAGLAAFEHRREYDVKIIEARELTEIPLAPELERTLKAHTKAWKNLKNLAPGYRKQYVAWLMSAKRPETRQRRLEEAIRLLERNKKLGMK